MKTEQNWELGFNSKCTDNNHILMWDFDWDYDGLDIIRYWLLDAQRKYYLSDIYVIRSRGGFNAICLDKFSSFEALRIKNNTPLSDEMHNFIGFKRNGWVLRFDNDKQLKFILNSDYDVWEKSNAHRLVLNVLFQIDIPMDDLFDNLTEVGWESYVRKEKTK